MTMKIIFGILGILAIGLRAHMFWAQYAVRRDSAWGMSPKGLTGTSRETRGRTYAVAHDVGDLALRANVHPETGNGQRMEIAFVGSAAPPTWWQPMLRDPIHRKALAIALRHVLNDPALGLRDATVDALENKVSMALVLPPRHVGGETFAIRRLLDDLGRAAHDIGISRDGAQARLFDIFRSDRPASRRAALAALQADHSDSEAWREASREALDDADPEVRLLAAKAAGEAGFPALNSIVRKWPNESSGMKALDQLIIHCPAQQLAPLMRDLVGRRSQLRTMATSFLFRQDADWAEEILSVPLKKETESAIILSLLDGIDASRQPRWEPYLQRFLDARVFSSEVCALAIDTLEHNGTALSLAGLARVAEGTQGALREAARKATEAIRNRHKITAGRLSVSAAASATGGLSSPRQQDGELAIEADLDESAAQPVSKSKVL